MVILDLVFQENRISVCYYPKTMNFLHKFPIFDRPGHGPVTHLLLGRHFTLNLTQQFAKSNRVQYVAEIVGDRVHGDNGHIVISNNK